MKENEVKVRNFDQLMVCYQNQSRELEAQKEIIQKLRLQNQHLLRNSIAEPHINNFNNFGGPNGNNFDGGVFWKFIWHNSICQTPTDTLSLNSKMSDIAN